MRYDQQRRRTQSRLFAMGVQKQYNQNGAIRTGVPSLNGVNSVVLPCC